MRFRAKFGALGWCWIGLACLVVVLWGSGRHSRPLGGLAVVVVLLALERVLAYIFVYWDVETDGLRARRMWKTKLVPWGHVKHVGSWNPRKPSSDYLSIEFVRAAQARGRGRILAYPEDRDEFIAALRKSAPRAKFDV